MKIIFTPPKQQISQTLSLIYANGMTTTSGGNISIKDEDGNIWITPAGIDKGNLSERDIVCVKPDGSTDGIHAPSSELPFHQAIYEQRPDLRAIIHAHPPALVSFSIVRKIPDTHVIPQAKQVCGPVGYASYKLPGSEELGQSIAHEFGKGYNALIMENHGTVVGETNLNRAFQCFETLEFCARTIIKAHQIGTANYLKDEQIQRYQHHEHLLPEMEDVSHPADEREIRSQICAFINRACRQQLMISTYGTVSVRWRGNDFLITPTDADRRNLEPEDIVQIKNAQREPGKEPSRSVRLHHEIYKKHPHISSIIITQSPNATAFCVSGQNFDTHTIPESYVLLKDIPLVPYGSQFKGQKVIPETLSEETPIVLLENDSILVTGKSLLETFDRLEVAEFSARSLINSVPIGDMVPIDDDEIEQLRRKFLS